MRGRSVVSVLRIVGILSEDDICMIYSIHSHFNRDRLIPGHTVGFVMDRMDLETSPGMILDGLALLYIRLADTMNIYRWINLKEI